MKDEYDINRNEYDKKVEDIRKKKRNLRNIQEPDLVKKIKKDLKREQRMQKHSDKNNLKEYLKEEIQKFSENNSDDTISED